MKPLSKLIVQEAISLFKQGKSIREVSGALHISISSAGRIKRRNKEDLPMPKFGRPYKVSKVTRRHIAREFDIGTLRTLKEGQREVELIEGIHVDERSIRKYLKTEHLETYLKQRMPDLTDDQKKARYNFAKKHLHWTCEDWKKVMFSDEVTFSRIDDRVSRHYYKRPEEKTLRPHHMKRAKQGGGGRMMVWGCVTYYGVGDASWIQGRINSEAYIEILHDYVFSSRDWYNIDPANFIFQHDNSSVHTAYIVRNYIRKSKIPIMEWPPNSPDLNIIETIWAYIKDRLYKYPKDAKDLNELWDRVQDIWAATPKDFIERLYKSMPAKMKAVVKSKGDHIKL